MKCLGRTASLSRCKKDARLLVCYQHRFQPYGFLLFIITLVGLAAGIYQDLIHPLSIDKSSIEDASFGNVDAMPFGTGWIFIGYYQEDRGAFIEGPYSKVAFRPGRPERGNLLPDLGDILRVIKPRHVIIANYKTDGLKYQLQSPPLVHDPLDADDETDVRLDVDTLLLVRDVELSGYFGRPTSVWCRVAACDSNTESCVRALQEMRG